MVNVGKHYPGNSNDRFFLASALGEMLIFDYKIRFFPAFYSNKGTLNEQWLQILFCPGASGGFFLVGTLIIRRGKLSPRTQMPVSLIRCRQSNWIRGAERQLLTLYIHLDRPIWDGLLQLLYTHKIPPFARGREHKKRTAALTVICIWCPCGQFYCPFETWYIGDETE